MIEEHGLFWWSDETVAEGHYAPNNAVSGLLTISDEGRIDLELHGQLPLQEGRRGFFREEVPPGKMISGLLKKARNYVLIESVSRNGSVISSNGISFDAFIGLRCLILDRKPKLDVRIKSIIFSLAGYEDWMNTSSVWPKIGRKKLTIDRTAARRVSAAHSLGRLSVEHHPEIRSRTVEGSKGVFINEHSVLKFSPKKPIDIERSCYFNELIQDLFVILTGSDYRSPWSRVLLSDKSVGTLYYYRLHSNQKPLERHNCLTFFADIENDFENIFFSWLEKSHKYGPGFYLYLSTRRGIKSYTEQRFFSLVSGLETLHRSIYGDEIPQKYQSKMDRIIKDISSSKDRKWLENKLQRFAAPNLDQRLFNIFSIIPIGLKADQLKTFCVRCSKMRNSLAHHGHVGVTKTTDDAYRPIFNLNETISCLYHLFIMIQIGVSNDRIGGWVINRMGYMHTRHYLEIENLIEKKTKYKSDQNDKLLE